MASKIDRCVNCHVSTLTFEPFCPCMPLCAFCIEKFLNPQLYLDCQDCECEARIDDFREMVLRIDTEVEAVLGRSLGLRRDNQCPSCSSPLHPENRVFFPCKDHFICFPCFNNLVDKALTSNRLLRCSDLHCNQEAFYYLSDFNGRLRIEQINRYDELVLKKSNIRQNKAKLEAMSQKFARCLHREGNNDPAQLRSMLESIANCTNIFEFRVTFTAREIRRCALAGCDNKVYDFQRVALPSSEEYACSLRCLQMHYLQLGADATSLKTKTGVLISKSALVISLPEGCFVATCDICYSDFLSFELSSLECHHPVCSSCLSEHISTLIIELKVDEDQFICPRKNCTCTIPPQMVQKLFPRGNKFDRFLRMRFEKMTKLSDSEIVLMCFQPQCQYTFAAEKPSPQQKDISIRCPACGFQHCGKCLSRFHPNSTCEDYKNAQSSLRDLGENIKACPTCFVPIEKEAGCNFMTCRSGKCKGSSWFCFICGEVLTPQDHLDKSKHFPQGPHADKCRVTMGRK